MNAGGVANGAYVVEGDEGEVDLLDFFAELTIYTSSACLIGKGFREELTPEYYQVFYDLERGRPTRTPAWAISRGPRSSFWARSMAVHIQRQARGNRSSEAARRAARTDAACASSRVSRRWLEWPAPKLSAHPLPVCGCARSV